MMPAGKVITPVDRENFYKKNIHPSLPSVGGRGEKYIYDLPRESFPPSCIEGDMLDRCTPRRGDEIRREFDELEKKIITNLSSQSSERDYWRSIIPYFEKLAIHSDMTLIPQVPVMYGSHISYDMCRRFVESIVRGFPRPPSTTMKSVFSFPSELANTFVFNIDTSHLPDDNVVGKIMLARLNYFRENKYLITFKNNNHDDRADKSYIIPVDQPFENLPNFPRLSFDIAWYSHETFKTSRTPQSKHWLDQYINGENNIYKKIQL